MTFSTITILLGVGYLLPQIYALVNPEGFRKKARAFPRNLGAGYFLTMVATLWFLYYVQLEQIADFAMWKKYMLGGFAALGVGVCIYLKDFLAIRGLAVFLLLLAKAVCDSGRWVESDLRLFVITWAYLWIIVGMWWTISPWRGRDWIEWNVCNDTRLRILSGLRAAFSIAVVVMGATVFRG